MSSSDKAQWVIVGVTFLAVVVALWKEDIQKLWRKPKFSVRVQLKPPDCHKTEIIQTSAHTGAILDRWPCYYLRIWVKNEGNVRAGNVQVFLTRLLRKHADGTFREEENFLPMNLRWSHTGEIFTSGINPDMGKHCDVGHMVHPDKTICVIHRHRFNRK